MELSNQVVSLELAKKLKDLGVIKPSIFCWFRRTNPDEWIICHNNLMPWLAGKDCNLELSKKEISAYTVAELGNILKILNTEKNKDDVNYFTFYDGEKWIAWEQENGLFENGNYIFADTEADARAKMLIHLIENKLIEV